MKNPNLGVYHKYTVTRTDGTSAPGEKHAECEHFVLDTTHDPYAKAALLAYAAACEADFPNLAADARRMATGERVIQTPTLTDRRAKNFLRSEEAKRIAQTESQRRDTPEPKSS